jgi:predicted outer membrane repeat protein
VISANVAFANGGGVEGGTILNSTLSRNTANSAGAAHGAGLSNCVFSRNSANANGGAVSSSAVYNSALFANSSRASGGAAEESTLVNCTVSGNSASISAGGVHNSTLNNCVVFFNNASRFPNFAGSIFSYCCTTPLPPHGANNITSDPQLTDGAHIGAGSPCITAGSSAYISGADIDGEAWNSPPSIGCDESNTGAVTNALAVSVLAGYTNVAVGFPVNLSGLISGHATNSLWNFGDGSFATNQLYVVHNWASPGDYV